MTDIYRQHEAAFSSVSAFVVVSNGERVASVAFKFPRDGAGRLYAYVHWIGLPMVRGYAAGGGYDKRSAACSACADRMPAELPGETYADGTPHFGNKAEYIRFRAELAKDDGYDWERRLRDAGFSVWQAV
jgi:hypothetical protein